MIGFPLGATLPQVKIHEAEEAIKLGAQEVDMVLNIGALKSGQDDVVESDIRGVVEVAHRGGAICKVIFETSLLTVEEKVRASLASKRAGADFVKTSTGFSTGGATAEDVASDARCGGNGHWRKSFGRSAHFRRFEKNGLRGRHANRRQRQRQNHGASGRFGAVLAAIALRVT